MAVASITELRAKLGEYLARVKRGEEVLVAERGKTVARLVPCLNKEQAEQARLEDLQRRGLIKLGTGKLPPGFWEMPRHSVPGNAAVEAIVANREEGP